MSAENFPINSRYNALDTKKLEVDPEKIIVYLERRFVPPPQRFALLHEHTVKQAERLDNITAHYLGDPEQFWRICDANAAMDPEDLTKTPGIMIRITLPEGIPGTSHA